MFEKIELLHRLYPVYLLGARMVAWLIFDDIDTYNMFVLQRLHAKTDMLLLLIRDNYLAATNKKKISPKATLPAADDGTGSPWGLSTEALQQHAFRPLHPAMVGQSADVKAHKGGRPAPAQKGGGRGVSSLLWFFLVYGFFQWLLGRTQ